MVRRVIEEDVATPASSTTVVDGDGSWIGRTIVTLVVLALVVIGGIYLVRALNNNSSPSNNSPSITNNQNNPPADTGNTVPSAPAPAQS